MPENFNEKIDHEVSLKEIIQKFKQFFQFLQKKWWKILIIALLGAIVGFLYATFKPLVYKAKLSFVVEEKASNSGGLAALAGQFGLDLGGATGTGLLSGENLLLFLKSNDLAKSILLTAYDQKKNYSLADKYADVYKLRKKWEESEEVGKKIFFPPQDSVKLSNRLQDSLLQVIVLKILKDQLNVERPEKKATFINVQTETRDELLSKFFCERLVQKATEIYIQSKTKRQKTNVDRLQRRTDSIGEILNNKTYLNASDQEKILDINPAAKSSTVNAEISGREKLMLSTIFGEVVKNLEIAKIQLNQETPTIQIVDSIGLPILVLKTSKIISSIFGAVLASIAFVIYLFIKQTLKTK